MNNMCHFSFHSHWFITHVVTIRFKTFMNVFALTHTIVLRTIYYKIIILYSNDMFKFQCLSNIIILFTRAFKFWEILGSHYEHIHISHSCFPLLDFFVHMIILNKLPWIMFTLTCLILIIILSSFVAYYHALNTKWPKQIPS